MLTIQSRTQGMTLCLPSSLFPSHNRTHTMTPDSAPIWTPRDPSSTRISRFRERIAAKYSTPLADHWQFWKWSVDHVDLFWEEVWDECGVVGDKGTSGAGVKSSDALYPPPRWFPDSRVNFAENLLRHHDDARLKDKPAVISTFEALEDGAEFQATTLTHAQLYAQVARAVAAFQHLGVKQGDVVAAYSSNNIPALVTFLAASSLGAIYCSISADSAPEAVLDRFETVRPKWITSVEWVRYNGKRWGHVGKLREALRRLEETRKEGEQRVEGVVLAAGPGGPANGPDDDVGAHRVGSERWLTWDEFLNINTTASTQRIPFARLEFNHPLWILFSSGTTGKPKAIVHRAGGMLLQLAKEHFIHTGLTSSDVFFQYSTLSWMMSPWGLSTLMCGSTLVLYDGSPLSPSPMALWHLAAQYGITHFGTSAAYLEAIKKRGAEPRDAAVRGVSSSSSSSPAPLKVRVIFSTGSSLRAELYHWVRDHIGEHVQVGSITGGTDICSLFAGNSEDLPVYAGEIQGPNLGMHVGIINDQDGRVVEFPPLHGTASTSSPSGDLVCLSPFPAQPLYFWNQPEERYRDSYYAKHGPRIWDHGDWCQWSPAGGLVMKGRSDGVLNPGGVRFGSGEIYEVVNALASDLGIQASMAVSLRTPSGSDEVVVLFLVLNHSFDASFDFLAAHLKSEIKKRRSARHVPRFVERVRTVPTTINGKLAEVPAKKALNGQALSSINSSTLVDPDGLQEYVDVGKRLRGVLEAEGL